MLGTLVSSAGSAVSAGRDVYGLGKLDAAEMARFDQTVLAAQQAADDLGLRFKPLSPKPPPKDSSVMVLPFFDDKGSRVNVRVERRAVRMVLVRIDVGLFGSEVTAHLMLSRLRAHLPRPPGPKPRRHDDDAWPAE
jgi:hypothetical protein